MTSKIRDLKEGYYINYTVRKEGRKEQTDGRTDERKKASRL